VSTDTDKEPVTVDMRVRVPRPSAKFFDALDATGAVIELMGEPGKLPAPVKGEGL
jgi:hypothetical protein